VAKNACYIAQNRFIPLNAVCYMKEAAENIFQKGDSVIEFPQTEAEVMVFIIAD
jgi:hypothetical protein